MKKLQIPNSAKLLNKNTIFKIENNYVVKLASYETFVTKTTCYIKLWQHNRENQILKAFRYEPFVSLIHDFCKINYDFSSLTSEEIYTEINQKILNFKKDISLENNDYFDNFVFNFVKENNPKTKIYFI